MPRPERGRAGIAVERLQKAYGRAPVLEGIDLAVHAGEFLCLLGPSGCGKTTLLRCIAGLERPDQGKITIGEEPAVDVERGVFVPPERRGLGMVFQHYALWPHMTVRENLAYPLRRRKLPAPEQARRIRAVMESVGLPAVLDHRPAQLSGGQQQRVALARALIYEPSVLLLDEPLSNIDAVLRVQLRRELRQLHERLGTTTVLVTHDQEEAAALADTIAVMDRGRVIQVGSRAAVFDAPRTRFVAEFVGFDNIIPGRVARVDGEQARIAVCTAGEIELPLPENLRTPGAEVLIAVRGDGLRVREANGLATAVSGLRGQLRHSTRRGRGMDLEVTVGEHLILVHGNGPEATIPVGADVLVEFLAGPATVMDRTDAQPRPCSS